MLRFISFLFNKPYETCKSCETLKAQLEFANAEKRELLDTLMNLIKPKVYEAAPQTLEPMAPRAIAWTKRRAMMEAADLKQAQIRAASKVIAKPDTTEPYTDSVDELEKKFGLDEEVG